MKKKRFLWTFLTTMMMVCLCIGATSCGSDSEADPIQGSGGENINDYDPSLKEVGFCYASFKVTITVSEELKVALTSMGVQISNSNNFDNPLEFSTNAYTGNTFEVDATGLEPGTTYYYRTFQQLASRSYGEIKSFKTKELTNSQIAISGGEPWILSQKRSGYWHYYVNFSEVTISINAKMSKNDFKDGYGQSVVDESDFNASWLGGFALFVDNKFNNSTFMKVEQKDIDNNKIIMGYATVAGDTEFNMTDKKTSFSYYVARNSYFEIYNYRDENYESIGSSSFNLSQPYYRPYIILGGQKYLIGESKKLAEMLEDS